MCSCYLVLINSLSKIGQGFECMCIRGFIDVFDIVFGKFDEMVFLVNFFKIIISSRFGNQEVKGICIIVDDCKVGYKLDLVINIINLLILMYVVYFGLCVYFCEDYYQVNSGWFVVLFLLQLVYFSV